ncbi:MAG: hypothetical protein QNJ98_14760, partial [Planctomycetota bacterium]|nr:hypothetical protein [Planctomycetota bacterium]
MSRSRPPLPVRLGDAVLGLVGLALLMPVVVGIEATEAPAHVGVEVAAARIDTLRFQLAVLLTPLVAYLLLVRRIRRAGVVVAVAAWAALPTLWWSTPDRTARADASPLRVLSMNLGGDLAADAEVMRVIDDKDPELVLLLEYTPERKRTLGPMLEGTHPHVHVVARSDNFGIAVFSKRPWTSLDVFNLARTGTPQLRIEMDVGGAP